MSTFIIPMFIQGYEDYERYEQGGNAFAGFPEMWPEEKYAEGALWREWKQNREEYEILRRMGQLKRAMRPSESDDDQRLSIVVRALVSIARQNHWRIKNQDVMKSHGCSPVYEIPPAKEDEPMPTGWTAMVRWIDRQDAKAMKMAEEALKRKEECESKHRRDDRIEIDAQLLSDIMGADAPYVIIGGQQHKPVRRTPKDRMELQAMVCAMLAEECGWKKRHLKPYYGQPITIYSTCVE